MPGAASALGRDLNSCAAHRRLDGEAPDRGGISIDPLRMPARPRTLAPG